MSARGTRLPRGPVWRRVSARQMAPWVPRLAGIPVLVWGDFVLDEYWRCRSSRVSREAPVLILDYQSRVIQGGGAANAALNLAALGAQVMVAGWVGADAAGRELRELLRHAGVDTRGLLVHPDASTVVKTRVVAGDVHTALQQVVRIDRGGAFPQTARERLVLRGAVSARRGKPPRAVVLSDYGYDSVTPGLARAWVARWRAAGVTVGLDARFRLADYRGISVATPNESETAAATGGRLDTERDLARVAPRLRRSIAARHLVVTRGRDGLTLWSADQAAALEAWGGHEAVDVTGAGDAVVAAVTLALAAGAPPLVAVGIANVAGSVAVSRRGAVAVRNAELLEALEVD